MSNDPFAEMTSTPAEPTSHSKSSSKVLLLTLGMFGFGAVAACICAVGLVYFNPWSMGNDKGKGIVQTRNQQKDQTKKRMPQAKAKDDGQGLKKKELKEKLESGTGAGVMRPTTIDRDQPKSILHKRLQTLDREAMELFRNGQRMEGERKIMDALDYWLKSFPPRCTPEESLTVAVLYVRILALTGKSLPKQKAMDYVTSTQLYSREGGIAPKSYNRWFDDVLTETVKAYDNR